MAHAKATIGKAHYPAHIETGKHSLTADEPAANGGGDTGPGPYDILLASLGACTSITLRMYADRKEWDLKSVTVDLHYHREGNDERIERKLTLEGPLSDEQRARIADIAERTPVTLTLKKAMPIHTELMPPRSAAARALDGRLDEALDETFPASDPPAVTPHRRG